MRTLSRAILITAFFLICQVGYADPWFTGSLLAQPAQTVPRGNKVLFLEVANPVTSAIYDREWQRKSINTYTSTDISPVFMYGLTDHIDIEYIIPYQINQSNMGYYEHIGDSSIFLGFQALSQKNNNALPNLRITIGETFPSGLYENFKSSNVGVAATGIGSYQTSLAFNFQYLSQLSERHYLNTYVGIEYTYASTVAIHGLSAYGGTSQTRGNITPGNAISLDWAAELTLTQRWVAVMEANFIYQQASRFYGTLGTDRTINQINIPAPRLRRLLSRRFPTKHNIGGTGIGNGHLDQISLAPALEYNFSPNYGVDAGVWFTVAGKNTPQFIAPVIEFTATW